MRKRITTRLLAVQEPEAIPYQIHDTTCRGFIYRMQPSGVATFSFMYRTVAGERRKIRIGRCDEVSLKEARNKAEEYRNSVALGGDPAKELADRKKSLTLRQFIDGAYDEWAAANLKSYKQTINRLRSGFAPLLDRRLADLEAWDFEKHRSWRLKYKLAGATRQAGPATVNRDFAHMRAALSLARKWKMIPDNPLRDVSKSKEDRNRQIRAMDDKEEAAMLRTFEARRARHSEEWAAMNRARAIEGRPPLQPPGRFLDFLEPLVITALDTGLRRGELFGLQWPAVDTWTKTITVHGAGAKSSQTRVVPMTSRVLATLNAWRAQCPANEYVFINSDTGKPLKSINVPWRDLCREAGVSKLRFHALRHTCASRLVRAGASVQIVKVLLGHSAIVTTARYLHATATDAENAIRLLER